MGTGLQKTDPAGALGHPGPITKHLCAYWQCFDHNRHAQPHGVTDNRENEINEKMGNQSRQYGQPGGSTVGGWEGECMDGTGSIEAEIFFFSELYSHLGWRTVGDSLVPSST